jgi:ribose transport system ATP-binding protein
VGVVKTFPGVRALDGVDLDVLPGEVHCLLGQNGAGKSTLIKVLAGAHRPDHGEIFWRGEPVTFPTPHAATSAGIATIYQELDLVDGLSVAENIFLGHEPRTAGFTRRGEAVRRASALLTRLGHAEIPPRRSVGALSAAGKQIVSIARALSYDAQLIVMDEPSAVLSHDEVANLFRLVRDLTAEGIAVIYISHRLEEIRDIGDRVTVLKDGRTAAVDLPARTTPYRELVGRMTGRSADHFFPDRPAAVMPDPSRVPLLSVRGLSRRGEFADVSFDLHAGEVVGIAGLVGSGRSELLETIYGARTPHAGSVTVDGKRLRAGSVGAAVRAGLGMAPEERKAQALLLDEPIYRNVTLASLDDFASGGFTRAAREIAAVEAVASSLALQPADVRRKVRTLSGGNQQKVVLARWLLGDAGISGALTDSGASPDKAGVRLLLLDEPTRGVDVGARTELYALIRRLAERGLGVLLVSSEVPEVLGLADRVLVMREGRLVAEAVAGALDEDTVLDLVMAGSTAGRRES